MTTYCVRFSLVCPVPLSIDSGHLINVNPTNGRSLPENLVSFFLNEKSEVSSSLSSSNWSKFDKSLGPLMDGIKGGATRQWKKYGYIHVHVHMYSVQRNITSIYCTNYSTMNTCTCTHNIYIYMYMYIKHTYLQLDYSSQYQQKTDDW